MNLILYNHNPANSTSGGNVKITDLLYRLMLYFVYNYVNFIVKQGAAIVTNLEHLKFFFLSNTNNVGTYNAANKRIGADYSCDGENTCDKLVKNEKIYFKKTPVTPTLEINERINMGQMEEYRLLSILQNLANQNPILENLETKKLSNGTFTLDLFKSKTGKEPTDRDPNAKKSLFVMFTNIKIFRDTTLKVPKGSSEDFDSKIDYEAFGVNKPIADGLCTAELDTLEFAQSISSSTQTVQTSSGAVNNYADEEELQRADSGYSEPSPVPPEAATTRTAPTASVARRPTTAAQSTLLRAAQSRRLPAGTVLGGSLNNNNITYQKFDMKALTKNHKRPKTHRNYKKTIKKSNKNNNQGKKHLARHSKKYNN